MRQPNEEEGFKTNDAGILTDLEEALWLIHELSVALIELTEDPRALMFLGQDAAMAHLMGMAGHSVSCDKQQPEQTEEPVKREDTRLPGFMLPPDLIEKLRNL